MKNYNLRPFHLAFPVKDLMKTKKWYTKYLNCTVGRESDSWIDFNLYGHQIVAHLSKSKKKYEANEVDNKNVPIQHFGVILSFKDWEKLSKNLKKHNINFLISPCNRFKNKKGEQHTLFITDPSGNAIEFKSFKNDSMIFEH